ncbi:MAG TPA: PEP/pyruvate-binding domain-containing protein, partial [Candidatus Saccharimonadales bacterium]|nr:PEP/pyruvate-binding domain-containing protein [Candidatus Saccharimonadales bacterium]
VVQKMVDSEKSGVMFTANPITSDRDTMIVEAVYGLGEMIVQGTMTPDHWDVAKQPLKVTNFEIAVKDEMMVYEDEENKIVKVPENLEDKAILREGGVLEIARLGLKIEEHYGKPQDIEWAFVDGNFYIVQSRPITTL